MQLTKSGANIVLRCTPWGSSETGAAQHTTVLTANAKVKVGCIFVSRTSYFACLGTSCVEATFDAGVLAGLDTTTIGVRTLATDTDFYEGKIREVAMWTTALATTDFTAASGNGYQSGKTVEALGADHLWRPGMTAGTDEGDVGGVDMALANVGTVPW
jgi:hypothetical protein